MIESFLFSGFGGQGVMFAGQLLAYAGMDTGLETTWIPSYGPEMRGGTAHCFVVLSDKPIGSPLVRNPKTALVFNNPSFEKYDPLIKTGGLLIVNSSMIVQSSNRTDITTLNIPATSLADELGSLRVANLIMLGAMLAANHIIRPEDLKQALADHIPAHHTDMLGMNYAAVDLGMEHAVQVLAR
nr:2-oxoacid:acceptor oxidoreductase family protein [Anaerolineae bacterium]